MTTSPARTSAAPEASGEELVITRVLDAPRARVWRAWTEAEQLKHWWGPKGFTMGVCKLDFRPGGMFHYSMRTPDGHELWGRFVYREILKPERIVFINALPTKTATLSAIHGARPGHWKSSTPRHSASAAARPR